MRHASENADTIVLQMFLRLLPAQILSMAVSSLGTIINGLVVGNCLPSLAMVALGFVSPLTAIFAAIASVISGGSRVLYGRYIGRNDRDRSDALFSGAVTSAVVIGLALWLCLTVLAVPFAVCLGAEAEAVDATADYIRALSLGVIPTLLIPMLMVFLQMSGESAYAFYSSVLLALGNLLFSLGAVKLLHGGVFAVGAATSLSQWVTMLFLALRFACRKNLTHFRFAELKQAPVMKMLKLGSPTALSMLLYSVRNIITNATAMRIGGVIAMNAMAVILGAVALFDAFNNGTGAALLMQTSVYVGERDSHALERLLRCSSSVGVLIGTAKLVIILLFGRWICTLFGAQGEVLEESYRLFIAWGVTMPINMLTHAIMSPYQSLGRVRFSSIFYTFNAFIFPVALVLGLSIPFGTLGIWYAYALAEVLSLLFVWGKCRLECGHAPKTAAEFLWLKEDFEPQEHIALSVTDMEQVLSVSQSLVDFCLRCGVDARRAKLCGLCMEEMAGNIVEHGFPRSKRRRPTIDLFVSPEENGTVLLRLRDNCPTFDPAVKFGAPDPDDPCKNIGIRMVSKFAQSMDYQSSFGMNVLTIRL